MVGCHLFLCWRENSRTKRLLILLHLGLEAVPEVDIDPKGRFVSFKVTPSNDRVLCAYALGIAPGNSRVPKSPNLSNFPKFFHFVKKILNFSKNWPNCPKFHKFSDFLFLNCNVLAFCFRFKWADDLSHLLSSKFSHSLLVFV